MSHNNTIMGSSLICSRHVGEGSICGFGPSASKIPIKVANKMAYEKISQFVDFNVFEELHKSTSNRLIRHRVCPPSVRPFSHQSVVLLTMACR